MFAAPADSRSVTFSSLAASFASVAPCRYLRCPFSVKTARHGSPSASGGYTTIPNPSSTTGRAQSAAGYKVNDDRRVTGRGCAVPGLLLLPTIRSWPLAGVHRGVLRLRAKRTLPVMRRCAVSWGRVGCARRRDLPGGFWSSFRSAAAKAVTSLAHHR